MTKYKKEDFPSIESVDKKEFEIITGDNGETVLDSYFGDREKIFVPYGVTEIESYAFKNKDENYYSDCGDDEEENRGSEYLEEVIFPDTVKKIGLRPFYGCKYLKRVYIPASVTFIKGDIFTGCPALEEIEIDKDNPAYKMVDGCLIDIENKTLVCGLAGCKIPRDGSVKAIGIYAFNMRAVESVEIPEGITKLANYTFTGCAKLKEVKLPSTLVEIGTCAFSLCSALTEIKLPENLKKIGEAAFSTCGINEIELPAGLEYLGKNAFWFSSLKRITLAPVKECGSALFEHCKNLERVEFLDGWKQIPVSVCKESRVKEVVLPDSVEKIGLYAFGFCYSLNKINFPPKLRVIEEEAFKYSGITELIFPESIKRVGWCAFEGCNGLKHVTVPPLVVESESYVFCRCENLESVIIKEGTKRILKNSFSSCKRLKSVTLPDSIVKIGSYAFGECRALREIELPKATEYAADAFYLCGVAPIDELALLDMPKEEYLRLSRIKYGITIRRR